VNQRAEADVARVLGKHCVQEQDVRHDLEPVVVEVVLGRPHGVVPEGVAVLGIRDEVRVDPTIVGLAVAPPVRWRPVDPRVWHIHGPIEKCADMHLNLQGLGTGEHRGQPPVRCRG
jgi:hypothetical protein